MNDLSRRLCGPCVLIGIRCSLSIPSKSPGAYYVRTAVRDKASGRLGSAYRFIEIPDLSRGMLALSSILLDEKTAGDSVAAAPESGRVLSYKAYLYNVRETKPALEHMYVLFRNGEEVLRSEFEPVAVAGGTDVRNMLIQKRILFENRIEPGHYLLLRSICGSGGSQQGDRFVVEDPRSVFYLPEHRQVVVYVELAGPVGNHRIQGSGGGRTDRFRPSQISATRQRRRHSARISPLGSWSRP